MCNVCVSLQTNPSVHVQSSSSASATGARLSKSSAIVPVSAAKQCMLLNSFTACSMTELSYDQFFQLC